MLKKMENLLQNIEIDRQRLGQLTKVNRNPLRGAINGFAGKYKVTNIHKVRDSNYDQS